MAETTFFFKKSGKMKVQRQTQVHTGSTNHDRDYVYNAESTQIYPQLLYQP